MKALVTGSNGQLGSELRLISKNHQNIDWVFTDINELNLANLEDLEKKLSNIFPDIIINCAAYTNVDGAEKQRELSNILNFKAVDIISKWSSDNSKSLIHLSTDYIFDGSSNVPLTEKSPTNPINYYGITKLKGEEVCKLNDSKSIIIRTSWVYSAFGKNFVKTILSMMNKFDSINVVDDQIGSPTYGGDLANIIMTIIVNKKWIPGIYNFSNEGEISWYEFAVKIKDICNIDVDVHPVKTSFFKSEVKRPKYSLLDKSKIKKTYKIKIPKFEKSLRKCLSILNYGK